MKGKLASTFRNESIPVSPYTQLRVVYKDKDTGVNKWELLRKVDAISLAKKMGLDLLLVDANGNPPVCKLDNFGQVLMAQKKKEKAMKESSKAVKVTCV
jgi:translation initiation factor IF-3